MSAPTLWDMHVHLDFMRDMAGVAAEASELGLGLFATTVTPEGYRQAKEALSAAPNVFVGAGLHPWWVADGRCGEQEVAQTLDYIAHTRFVGEIGLDLSPKHVPAGSFPQQLSAFEAIARTCTQTSDPKEPKILSIHSVRAAAQALDALDEAGTFSTCACIFHWFSGTSDELHRAVKAGCWFSINEMMLRTRRGREYARQLPTERLLLETDLPPGEDVPFLAREIVAQLERTIAQLTSIRGTDIQAITCENSARLLGA